MFGFWHLSRQRKKIASVVVGLFVSLAAQAVSETQSGGNVAFDREHRVVLVGQAAEDLVSYCGRIEQTLVGGWEPTAEELDSLEAALAPRLKADLEDEGSSNLPHEYYRQYGAAYWGERKVVYILGFHEGFLADIGPAESHWRSKPLIVSDGGASFWCAVYIVDQGRFAIMKREGRPPRTVRFHGYA